MKKWFVILLSVILLCKNFHLDFKTLVKASLYFKIKKKMIFHMKPMPQNKSGSLIVFS